MPARLNLPAWVCEMAYASKMHAQFDVFTGINPFYITADLNGDGRIDAAVWIRKRHSGKIGLAIFHGGASRPVLLAAGRAWKDRGDDLAGIDGWSLVPKGTILESPYEDRKLPLRTDSIVLVRSESAAFVLYWTGGSYTTYQTSD